MSGEKNILTEIHHTLGALYLTLTFSIIESIKLSFIIDE